MLVTFFSRISFANSKALFCLYSTKDNGNLLGTSLLLIEEGLSIFVVFAFWEVGSAAISSFAFAELELSKIGKNAVAANAGIRTYFKLVFFMLTPLSFYKIITDNNYTSLVRYFKVIKLIGKYKKLF